MCILVLLSGKAIKCGGKKFFFFFNHTHEPEWISAFTLFLMSEFSDPRVWRYTFGKKQARNSCRYCSERESEWCVCVCVKGCSACAPSFVCVGRVCVQLCVQ